MFYDQQFEMAKINDQNSKQDARLPEAHQADGDAQSGSDCEKLNDLPDIVDFDMAMAETQLPSKGTENAPFPSHIESLAGRGNDAGSVHTRRAYASDWKHFCAWCRRHQLSPLTADPQTIGLYITDLATGSGTGGQKSISTIERRLSSLSWNFAQRGQSLDRKDSRIANVLAGIRNGHAKPAAHKEAISPQDLVVMLETLDRGILRGLRDRAMLLLGFSGGLRRSEIAGLDAGQGQTGDGRGWITFQDKGLLITLRGKSGWREIEIGRASSEATCPVAAMEIWLKFARIDRGPLFRRVTGQGKSVGPDRLNDQEIARLVKKTALATGIRGDLPEGQRKAKFGAHSLRAGFASGRSK
ncbi:integrase [Foliimonas ilicis]